jgi:hypothetical protein
MDRRLSIDDIAGLGCAYRFMPNFEVDLSQSEEQILNGMDSDRRRCIRKAVRDGIIVEEATDLAFAEEYYAQLVDVFARQSLVPTVTVARVRTMIECLLPTGNILLLRVREPDGDCIATGIFPAMNDTAHFWGGASWRKQGANRRNEAMHWHAMTTWRNRGMTKYDMGGGGEYKRKYGGREIRIPWIRKSRYPGMSWLREGMRLQASLRQRLAGRTAQPETPLAGSG